MRVHPPLMFPPPTPTPPPKPTAASIIVSLLILLAAAATIALFAIPTQSPYFWPTTGVLALAGGAALVIPLKPKR